MECVVRAQISRMFAYEAPEVGQDDVVMAADVDAFVMSEKVTLPLRRDRKIWEAIQLLKIIRANFLSGSKAIFGPFFDAFGMALEAAYTCILYTTLVGPTLI